MSTTPGATDQASRLEKYFIRNSFLLVFIELGTKILGLVLFVFIARILGARLTGIYSFGIALTTLLTILPAFGFDRVVQREVGRDETQARKYFLEISLLKIVLSVAAAGLIYVIINFTSEENTEILMLIAVFVLTFSFTSFVNSFFRAMGHPQIELLTRLVFSVFSVGLGIWALTSGYGLQGVVTAQISAIVISLALAVVLLLKKTSSASPDFSYSNLKGHLITAAPFALNIVILYLGNQINYVLLGIMVEETSVGYFSTAYRVFDTITLIPAAVMGAFLPLMSRLHVDNDARFHRVLRFTLRSLFMLSIGITIGTWMVGDDLIVSLFSADFLVSGLVLKIMNTSLVFSFWNFVLTNLLISTDREKLLIPLFSIGAVVHIIGNLVLISLFGVYGAAGAIIVTQFVQFALLSAVNGKYLSIGDYFSRFIPIGISLGIMSATAFLLLQFNIWFALAGAAVSYPLALLLLGGIRRSDANVLKHIVSKEEVA